MTTYRHDVINEISEHFDQLYAGFEQQLFANLLAMGLRLVPERYTKDEFDGIVLLALYDDKLYEGYLEFVEGILE
jgi:hypothetical protein